MDLSTTLRTHAAGELRAEHAGEEVTLCGWVQHRRDHGGVIFLDVRDREGVVQVVFHPADAPEAYAAADRARPEWVVRVTGAVRARPEGTVNPNLGTGEVEVAATTLEALSEAEPPPFPIEDRIEADEITRLRYRYLDLRRPEMTRVLAVRHTVASTIRRYFDERGFREVETPVLTRSTPEGARDFLVPARLAPGSFYALPQSPQLFKQILMVAGQDRYYQVVKCFRDEAMRADRQPEFTQLDVEMSFVTEEDIHALMEPLMVELVKAVHGTEPATPFPRLSYADAMDRYGSDKPDMRYGDSMIITDLAGVFASTRFRAFSGALEAGNQVRGIVVRWGDGWSRKDMDRLEEQAKGRGAAGLVWLRFEADEVRSPVAKFLSAEEVDGVRAALGASEGDVAFIVADRPDRVAVALDGLRRDMAERFGLAKEGEWAFLWIVEPPLFEWNEEEERWDPVHHPFTSPATEDIDPATTKARAYDLVLNGFELGGGSIRIHRPDVQRRVFAEIGLTEEEAEEKFGFLLQAFRFGVPPHGGIALGLDRIAMLLAGKDNIREVVAFPKTQSGSDPLTGAPAAVDEAQLKELGIRLAAPPVREG
jgi:aspartyl-tRNA synthetase